MASFDLVVATVGRADALDNLFTSLDAQTHRAFRVLLVDQNDDDRVERVVARHPSLQVERHRSTRGLSHARNVALPLVRADVVAFPDDDCIYPNDVLARVAARFDTERHLDGLTGRDNRGRWPPSPTSLNRSNLWQRAISFTIFLRASVVARVGQFDEHLGLPHSSAEEIDYLVRALDADAHVEYDPSLLIQHDAEERPLTELGVRDGRSIGYILRKHRYPPRAVARMLVRPVGGAVIEAARGERARARFHAATFRGRVRGYLASSSRNNAS